LDPSFFFTLIYLLFLLSLPYSVLLDPVEALTVHVFFIHRLAIPPPTKETKKLEKVRVVPIVIKTCVVFLCQLSGRFTQVLLLLLWFSK
jgi:hypothetical protein